MKHVPIPGLLVLGVTVLFSLAPLLRGAEELPVAQHHLLHAALLVGAALAGILCCRRRAAGRASPVWLVVAVLAPVVAMMAMWPSEYSFFERHPAGHALEHLGIIGCGFLCGFAGERFAAGVGWATGGSIVLMAFVAAPGYGVAPPSAVPAAAVAAPPAQTVTALSGATIYATNCAACHGAKGEGVSGPSLQHERSRKDLRQTVAWIENPLAPMPKFYPEILTAAQVGAVAAYVQTL